ncbi:MAG: DUF736 domain-containing protein [Oceanicaulis sp.]
MSKIGTFTPQNPSDFFADLKGHLRTLQFQAEARITQNRQAPVTPDAPTHSVTVRGPSGEFIEVGAGWTKEIMRGVNMGDHFLSVTLDDPSFPHPLNFAVFKEGDKAVATWRRRQDQTD